MTLPVVPPVPETPVTPPADETPAPPPTETVEPPVDDLQKKYDELARHAKNKEEEAARVQKKLAEFEKADEDRKKSELSEIDRLKLEKEESDKARTEAEKKLADQSALIAAEKSFSTAVIKLNLGFFNDKARDKVFALMDVAKPDEFEEALKQLKEAEPYYFKTTEAPELDSTTKGKNAKNTLTDAQKAELTKRFRIK